MASIPSDFHDLFEKPTFAHFATLFPDGSPHVTPVWIDYESDRVLVNSERGRQKEKNVRNDPRVGVSMTDPENPYRMLSVTGRVDEITTKGAKSHIDKLAHRYLGHDEYQNPIQTERVIISINPDRVRHFG